MLQLLLATQVADANDALDKLSQDPKNWVLPTGDYANTRYSKLSQINAANVGQLQVAWTFSTGVLHGHQGGPLIVGNTMYVHTPFPNKVYALDLSDDNKILWKYEPKQDPNVVPVMCCDTVSQGVSFADGKIFLYQADTKLVALDANTGEPLWSVTNGDPTQAQTATSAPFIVKDKVLVGLSGADFGVRCHVTAYDIRSGQKIWRVFSAGPDNDILVDPEKTTELGKPVGQNSSLKTWRGEQWRFGGGCASSWMSYDPALNLFYYGTGRPGNWNPKQRPGDNKWSTAIFARDPDTGVAKWVYQLTPANEWAYDTGEMILSDQQIGEMRRKLITHFDGNGLAYTLDRSTGELITAEKYDASVNWTSGVDMTKNSPTYGRPRVLDAYSTDVSGADVNKKGVCPSSFGAKKEQPAAYSPETQLFYVPTSHTCMDFEPYNVNYTAGQPYVGAKVSAYPPPGDSNLGNLIAWDGRSGKIVWSNKERFSVESGVLATAGRIVFYGTLEGYLKAIDAKTGKELYKFKTPSGIIGNVTTYEHAGKQYVAVLSGVGGQTGKALAAGLSDPNTNLGAVGGYSGLSQYTALGGTVTAFALPENATTAETATLPDGVKALQPVYYATNRVINDSGTLKTSSFTSERNANPNSESLRYGLTVVSIPVVHKIGQMERPFDIWQALYQPWNIWKVLTDKESDGEHFRIRGITPLGERQFVEALRTRTESDAMLLFVHGYNTSFERAIFKAAQMAYDANFKGHVLVFSWPSADALADYDYDQVAADTSKNDLLKVFQLLKEVSGKKLYIVAHSLGNRVVLDTLELAAAKNADLKISELVMAAPDVDYIRYGDATRAIKALARNMTMYASSADWALTVSGFKARAIRAGYIDSGKEPNLYSGVDTIDVTAVGEDMLKINHDTQSTSRMVLEDIGHLISSRVHQLPEERITTLKSLVGKQSMKYWYYPQ
ncbi:PQQ-dependent dehydrogenase, methanol/ethanol family [Bradyrhizobium jicamae]|uniref:PQQ-dependent dehydrogenase, methanol/ethanol family n=2 Tax=Bradyrhizobium jicamae TaxID=280332 RepID=A0ABS5FFV5_9BRAD|nr:PQQ-dependent dehydrogenase, methanol/ethanol family [Bradyrhizobium jicamae]